MRKPLRITKEIENKEIDLVRKFKDILERLPFDFTNAIFSHLITSALPDDQKSNLEDLILLNLEKQIYDANKWRIDLSVSWKTNYFKEILFEFKRGNEDWDQLHRYYQEYRKQNESDNPLIVSICKHKSKMNGTHPNILSRSWDEFAMGLVQALGSDAKDRLSLVPEEDTLFNPSFPKRKLGEPAEGLLEDFLRELINQKIILSDKGRVLVVTGKKATQTTKQFGLTWFGKNWDRSFQYLVVVYQKKLQYVGKIKAIYEPEEYNDGQPGLPQNLEKPKLDTIFDDLKFTEDEKKSFLNSPVAELEEIQPSSDNWGLSNESLYEKKGAITQSHRYFDSISDFVSHFKS